MSVQLTNQDKIYFPKGKITKGDLINYYAKIAPNLLRYTKNRPLVMKRFPNGIKGVSFFQKDVKDPPSFVKTALIRHKNRSVQYILMQNVKTLKYVANLGSIEMHLFHSKLQTLEKPDYLLLDLDPTSISFNSVVEVALVIHKILKERQIQSFCKTSGKRGLHILVSTKGKYTYEETKSFAKIIAKKAHEALPKITSLERSPSKRKKKVYIDCLQNAKGQLMIAPYSLRATPTATVSTPLLWSEVKRGLDPKNFTIENVLTRVKKKGDILKPLLSKSSNLKKLST